MKSKIILFITLFSSCYFSSLSQDVTTIAGPNTGINDALIIDSIGNIYGSDFGVSTTGASSVYKIDTTGVITTFSTGYSSCNGLSFDKNGNLYVVDFVSANGLSNQIYKLDSVGNKTTYGPIIPGASGILFDPLSDTLYISQYSGASNKISKLTPDGTVSLYSDHNNLNGPVGMAFDDSHNFYVANFNDGEIYKVTHHGDSLQLLAKIPNQSFYGIGFLTYASGYLYATGIGVHKVFRIGLNGGLFELAGSGKAGGKDGVADSAQFSRPNGIATNASQDKLYISDLNTKAIREITNLDESIGLDWTEVKTAFTAYNYPNPANKSTTIFFKLRKSAITKIELFSNDGKQLKLLQSSKLATGENTFELDTFSLKNGVYYVHIGNKDYSQSIKICVHH